MHNCDVRAHLLPRKLGLPSLGGAGGGYGRSWGRLCISLFFLLLLSVFFLTFAALLYRSVMGQAFLPATANSRLWQLLYNVETKKQHDESI